MNEVTFPMSAVISMIISGVLMFVLAICVFIILKIKLKLKWKPVITGLIVFPLFALVLKVIPAYPLVAADNAVSRAVNASPWLTYLVAGVLAGVFEETGRFVAYKTVLKNCTDRNTSIGYGIGHGGFECLYLGFSMFSLAAMFAVISAGGFDTLAATMNEASKNALIAQIDQYSKMNIATALFGVIERSTAIAAQIGLSIFVFEAARNKKRVWLYPLMIVVHFLVDFSMVFYAVGYINVLVMEIMIAAFAAAILFLAIKLVYKKQADVSVDSAKEADAE